MYIKSCSNRANSQTWIMEGTLFSPKNLLLVSITNTNEETHFLNFGGHTWLLVNTSNCFNVAVSNLLYLLNLHYVKEIKGHLPSLLCSVMYQQDLQNVKRIKISELRAEVKTG